MKEIKTESISIERANESVGEDLPLGMWAFLVGRLSYPDIQVDAGEKVIRYPGFIPIEQLLGETLEDIRRTGVDARPCTACGAWMDVNVAEGIFAKPDALEGFICERCARDMSAWTYFHEHLTR
jgi:hypothetical protein